MSLKLLRDNIQRDARYNYKSEYQCTCGTVFITRKSSVVSGATKSCGCIVKKHGLSNTREYRTWESMINRTTNTESPRWKYYGGRGISVCDSWKDFKSFYADMAPRPLGKSLDRIDNNKGYSKENCRWATQSEQLRNRRKYTHEKSKRK